ncbi:hypothetical protein [Sphingobium sp. BHU LFT2]|uniref:hypothetical protein n=1 Tax=Sphingobium sp. BHU LFT2 TaxID=2807634 RepID=UPI0020358DFC|nr:hypothetical protein [Sphingobium sp. BHU LFT2]
MRQHIGRRRQRHQPGGQIAACGLDVGSIAQGLLGDRLDYGEDILETVSKDIAMTRLIKNPDEIGRINLEAWADRKSVQSSLETVIRMLTECGVVDRSRIGITGLSDGAATVFYA